MKLEKAFVLILIVFMFALPFSYTNAADSQEIKYKNWNGILQMDLMLMGMFLDGLLGQGHVMSMFYIYQYLLIRLMLYLLKIN